MCHNSSMKIVIIGASGYIGTNLIGNLLAETDYNLVALSPHAVNIPFNSERLEKINCDVFDTVKLHEAIKKCDICYYLVHMMSQKKDDFAAAEARATTSLVEAVHGTKLKRIIYLGGLGADDGKLSKHLTSRHLTGQILCTSKVQIIELRASMIIGRGSISYDIITNLVRKLPIVTLPAWSKTLTQPLALKDAISYLRAAADISTKQNEIVEIGGPQQLSYKELMKRYAKWKGSLCVFVDLPIIPASVAAWWLNIFTPKKHAKVGRYMVESINNPMVVTNNRYKELFPDIEPIAIDQAFV